MKGTIETKAKRMRCNPIKKWTVEEEKMLVKFLLENRNFEKPTAQLYYKRYADVSGTGVEWKVSRSKVRNMRTTYNKAKAWEGSTETVKTTLLKMCPMFYEFEDLFGGRVVENAVTEDSLSLASNDAFNSIEVKVEEETMSETDSQPSSSRNSRTAVSDVTKIQGEMLTWQREKFVQELALKERELLLREREFALKEKEVDLKEKEINSHEKIKILELEMKERLAMEEMKLKYK